MKWLPAVKAEAFAVSSAVLAVWAVFDQTLPLCLVIVGKGAAPKMGANLLKRPSAKAGTIRSEFCASRNSVENVVGENPVLIRSERQKRDFTSIACVELWGTSEVSCFVGPILSLCRRS
jgi:hypothetical protein